LLALLWNIVRAVRFLQPIFKGVSLLRYDVDARRRDINSQLAHQTRRVDGLAAEAEAAASHADAAERRASVHKAAGLQDRPLPNGIDRRSDSVPAFFNTLDTAMRSATSEAPRRIVVAIDGFDHLPGDTAAAFLKTAQRLLGAGFVMVIAADRSQLAAGFTETDPARASADLGRCVQLSYNLGWSGAGDDARSLFANRLLEGGAAPIERSGDRAGFDPRHSALDTPWHAQEAETVAALAPFAGESPRAVKQFVNVYRVARADPRLRDAAPSVFTALALGLALDSYGFPDDLAALQSAAAGDGPRDSDMLQQALAAARTASGEAVDLGQARQGLAVARHYTARG
jgi:KAP family P-loop domain